jgi:hypothetical protein
MIGTSFAELVLIRACIFGLSSILPLSAFYLSLAALHPPARILPLPLEIWCAAEVLFYLIFYLRRQLKLQEVTPFFFLSISARLTPLAASNLPPPYVEARPH